MEPFSQHLQRDDKFTGIQGIGQDWNHDVDQFLVLKSGLIFGGDQKKVAFGEFK